MGIINQLDFQVANLIAAGEVVDRPASAVKELVENSIDAGATEIIVEIKHGGISFIRVTDNGCGISREDLPIALKRHATSKISKASDLDSITTLGFRGEALAAISSVSRVRIMTKRECDEVGTLLVSEFGKVTDITDSGGRKGTTIIVEELFSNVPARRKFLKRDVTEGMAIASAVEKQALARPDVSISLISDSVQKFKTPGDGNILSALRAVFGKDFTSKLAQVSSMTEGIEVGGYVGLPENVRANRNYQIFFINGRYIKSRTVCAALEQAFDSYLESSKFPCGVLYIYIHPAFVDVNVHPTKLEVKFSNDRSIFDAVYCAVKNALMNYRLDPELDVQLQPRHVTSEKYDAVNAFVPIYDRIASDGKPKTEQQTVFSDGEDIALREKAETKEISAQMPISDNTEREENKSSPLDFLNISFGASDDFQVPKIDRDTSSEISDACEESEIQKSPDPINNGDGNENGAFLFSLSDMTEKQVTNKDSAKQYKILGTALNAYIFVEYSGKVLVVDKHAAHERILFEDMRRILDKSEKHSQLLMIPEEIGLGSEELAALLEFSDEIKALGFDYVINDRNKTAVISRIPSLVDIEEARDLLVTALGQLASGTGRGDVTAATVFERALYQASCKAAMKAGIVDNETNTRWIVDRLFEIPDIKYCPHGRPCTFELTASELEKRFKRT